jgi:hypothetical protein
MHMVGTSGAPLLLLSGAASTCNVREQAVTHQSVHSSAPTVRDLATLTFPPSRLQTADCRLRTAKTNAEANAKTNKREATKRELT